MKRFLLGTAVVFGALYFGQGASFAAPLVADGVSYSLTQDALMGLPLTDQFTLTITGINKTGVGGDTEGGRTGVNALAFNPPSHFASATMITPPSGYVFVSGGLNSGGCDGSGNFFCFDNTAIPPIPTTPYAANSSLSFVFDVTLASGNFTGYAPDFKIDWVGSKNNYDLVSKAIPITIGPTINPLATDVPEPVSMSILGVGLASLGYLRRRRA